MRIRPFADADARLQAIFVCRSEVNASVEPAHCRFLRCIEAGWKAAGHAGQKIGTGGEGQIFRTVKEWEHSRGCAAERAMPGDVIRERWCHDERCPVQ